MTATFQLVIDCADPEPLARFWVAAPGYEFELPPEAMTAGAHIPGRLVSAAGKATRRPPARMTRITSHCCHGAGYRGLLPAESGG